MKAFLIGLKPAAGERIRHVMMMKEIDSLNAFPREPKRERGTGVGPLRRLRSTVRT
jgi:hypothetical protein